MIVGLLIPALILGLGAARRMTATFVALFYVGLTALAIALAPGLWQGPSTWPIAARSVRSPAIVLFALLVQGSTRRLGDRPALASAEEPRLVVPGG